MSSPTVRGGQRREDVQTRLSRTVRISVSAVGQANVVVVREVRVRKGTSAGIFIRVIGFGKTSS